MSFNQKNNKSQKSVQLTRRYSTRQIMELTEKRRKQMLEEEARLTKLIEPPTLQPPKTDHPQNDSPIADTFIKNTVSPQEQENVVNELKVEESSIPDGKAVAGFFRQQPENPTEEIVSDLIEQEFNKAVEHATPAVEVKKEVVPPFVIPAQAGIYSGDKIQHESTARINSSVQLDEVTEVTMDSRLPWPVVQTVQDRRGNDIGSNILLRFMEAAFIATTFVFLVMMMTHLLNVGWNKHYYDQGPFVLMMTLSIAWLNRKNFARRKEWFWGSAVILAGGIGVFLAAVIDGRAYIELAGFLIVCFSLFLWRYEEASACRLIFPLSCMLFIFAPPGAWEEATIAPLNEAVFRASAWIMNSIYIPAQYDGTQFHVGGGSIVSLGDPTAFRSIAAAAVLASACMSFQNMAVSWSLTLFLSAAFWAVLGNIIRITTTGMMLENFGVEYASMFFTEYSVIVVMFVMLAGLALTSGLLPHKEE